MLRIVRRFLFPFVSPLVLVCAECSAPAFSMDDAQIWSPLDSLSWWSVDAAGPGAVWMAGPEGRIAHVAFEPAP